MSESTQQILDSIPALVEKADVEALAALRDHANKQVRKAVRRGEHKLASRGVKLAEATGKSWTASSSQSLRGQLESSGHIDVQTHPGFTHLWWISPDAESGGSVDMIVLSGHDRVMDFATYGQTDSQRNRLLTQWKKQHASRRVPADWVRSRIRWARTQTIAQGHAVPPTLDRALVRVGTGEDNERPANFLLEHLPEATKEAAEMPMIQLLAMAGVPAWPVVVEPEPLSNVIAEASKILKPEGADSDEDAEQPDEAQVNESLAQALATNHALRPGLTGPIANILDDAGIAQWLQGNDGAARRLIDLAHGLRTSDSPEGCEGVTEIVRLQLASAARSDAAARARAEQQAAPA